MSSFLDTNVIVYAFDKSAGTKRAKALEILDNAEGDHVVSAQVLSEFYVVATSKLKPALGPIEAGDVVDLLRTLPVVVVDDGLVAAAITTARDFGLSLWDAQIIEAAARAGCDVLLTEDLNAGQIVKGVVIENPFA